MGGDLQVELALVRSLILEAGAVLLERSGDVGAIDYKGTVDMVTDIDRQVEAALRSGLERHFPGDTILGEEGGGAESRSGRTWYVDPLDGTTNFVHGYPFYSVSIGCADPENLLLGAVYAPYLDELYLAIRECGATLERPRAQVQTQLPRRQPVALERALLATGFPYVRDETVDRNVEYLRRFLRANCHGVRRAGSAAIDLAHTAAGKLDGYWELHLQPWDVAAGTLIAREAGVVVTGFDGQEGRLHCRNVVAAAPGVHGQLLAVLGEPSNRRGSG